MSFQFPADPSDGTVIVNGDIKGTYDEATNTWVVEKMQVVPGVPGPPGPQGNTGVTGPPGSGVEVSGVVETQSELPTNAADNTFWIVNDNNSLWFWNGTYWTYLGSPFQGPVGPKGETGNAGADGTNGADGANGDGWSGTEIITDNDEYKIKFLSPEPYLQFTTDNLKGEPGELQVASETNLGGIKIGRGLDIDAGGTASAGKTDVIIETIPLPGTYTQTFQPLYLTFGSYEDFCSNGFTTKTPWISNSNPSIQMPPMADSAAIFWFAGSVLDITPSATDSQGNTNGYTAPNGSMGTFRAFLKNTLALTDAQFSNGNTSAIVTTNLNMTMEYHRKSDGTTTMDGRGSTNQLCKFDIISFLRGGSIGFTWNIDIQEMSRGKIASGGLRMMILPYQSGDVAAETYISQLSTFANYSGSSIEDIFAPPTPTQVKDIQAATLSERINVGVTYIDSLLKTYTDDADQQVLNTYRADMLELFNLPGTYTDVDNALISILDAVNTTYGVLFRFQDA